VVGVMEESIYKKLVVWQKAFNLAKEVYKLTSKFPKEEQFGIILQIRRAIVSVVSNIAEGVGRFSKKEKIQFFVNARSSLNEVETQLELSKELDYFKDDKVLIDIQEIGKMLNSLINSYKKEIK
jgi:four helix bundle protein